MTKRVEVFSAANGAESAMIASFLQGFGFDARPTEDMGTQGGTPINILYPVTVPEDQAEEARAALDEQWIADGVDPDLEGEIEGDEEDDQ